MFEQAPQGISCLPRECPRRRDMSNVSTNTNSLRLVPDVPEFVSAEMSLGATAERNVGEKSEGHVRPWRYDKVYRDVVQRINDR